MPFDFADIGVSERGGFLEFEIEGISTGFADLALEDAVIVGFDDDMAGVFKSVEDSFLDCFDMFLVWARRSGKLRGE